MTASGVSIHAFLAALMAGATAAATPTRGPSDGTFVQGIIGIGPALRAAPHAELGGLFQEQGLFGLSSHPLSFALLVQGSLERFRVTFGWDVIHDRQDLERLPELPELLVPVSQRLLNFGLGFDVVQTRGFALFPSAGLALGDLTLSYDPRIPLWEDETLAPADDAAPEDIRPVELTRGFNALDLGLGFEQVVALSGRRSAHRHARFGFAIALRLGYRWQLSDTAWSYIDEADRLRTLETGPALDGTGPYVHFALGVGATE